MAEEGGSGNGQLEGGEEFVLFHILQRLEGQDAARLVLIETLNRKTATPYEKLRAFQLARSTGLLGDPYGFYVVALLINRCAQGKVDEVYRLFAERFDRAALETGWSPDAPASEDTPAEIRELEEELDRAEDRVYAEAFRRFGEEEMARMYEEDREGFERLCEEGAREVRRRPNDDDLYPAA